MDFLFFEEFFRIFFVGAKNGSEEPFFVPAPLGEAISPLWGGRRLLLSAKQSFVLIP